MFTTHGVSRLWPFFHAEHLESAATELTEALKDFKPFKLTFRKFGVFAHKKSGTVYCAPETEPVDALKELQAAMMAVLPECTDLAERDGGFTPHLTVGQWPNRGCAAAVEKLQADWTDFEFTVDHVQVIARGKETPFKIEHIVKLGG